ncbi:hypothetical protein FGG08_005065 [Glutinoglossum americanum]|uniref:Uncharacterized protein n=1 Tax=Glutinoglossum americanum TaxID=1670608 RepID=A0A9P8IA61_9PEZI|nr:hypothetical protein FGG08_005065 [Glutinoglossum americanum]
MSMSCSATIEAIRGTGFVQKLRPACPGGKCSERNIVQRIDIPGVPVPKPPPKPVVPIAPKPAEPGVPNAPGRMPEIAPEPKPAPRPADQEAATRVCKRASDDDCADVESLGSDRNLRYVGMGRTKTSRTGEKPIAVTGLNGCTGVFFHGEDFVTGTHADAGQVAEEAAAGAQEAKSVGEVTQITIKAPDHGDFVKASNAVKGDFPDAQIVEENYVMTDDEDAFFTFTATPGSKEVNSQKDHL